MHDEFQDPQLQHHLQEALLPLIGQISRRLTGPDHGLLDVRAFLADRQVRPNDLSRIDDFVSAKWPAVLRIFAGLRWGEELYVSVELSSSDPSCKKRHWPIEDWIKQELPGLADIPFFLHGPVTLPNEASLLFERATC